MARIKPGVPTVKEIREGESEYRYISGTGLVLYTRYNNRLYSTKMHEAPTPPIMDKKLEVAIGDRVSSSVDEGDFIKADGSVTFTGNQSHGGNDITGVNDLIVSDDVEIGDDLDVDGHTTLDQVTVNTTDGAFAVSGANPINLTTTGTNDINITTAQTLDVGIGVDYELDVTRNCDWNTAVTDWDNSNTFTLTSLGNITIETDGTDGDSSGNDDSTNTILIKNANTHGSSFTGIHIKTDSQTASSSYNGILIECDGIAAKSASSYGVDIRSEANVLIRAEDANGSSSHPGNVQVRASGYINIGSSGSALTSPTTTVKRVKIHGPFETGNLWRASDDAIVMDKGTIEGGSATGEYTKFQALDTYHLVRAMTYRTSTTDVFETDTTCHVTSGSSTVTHDSNSQILKGMPVTGTGIPANTFVGGTVNATQFSLTTSDLSTTVNATAGDGSEITLSFKQKTTIKNGNSIGIVHKDNDDLATGTAWLVTVTWALGSVSYAQVWYAVKQNNDAIVFLSGEGIDGGSGGVSGAGDATGTLSWDSSYGIIWTNNSGSTDATYVKCSALKLQSGTHDF